MDLASEQSVVVAPTKDERADPRIKTNTLNFDFVSQYFEIPIGNAAKELHVSLTTLKYWCRENDIPRWPFRKFKCVRMLMKRVQERPGSIGIGEGDVAANMKMLEEELVALKLNPKGDISPQVNIIVKKVHGLGKIRYKEKLKKLKEAKKLKFM